MGKAGIGLRFLAFYEKLSEESESENIPLRSRTE